MEPPCTKYSLAGRWAPGRVSAESKSSAGQEHSPTFLGKVTGIILDENTVEVSIQMSTRRKPTILALFKHTLLVFSAFVLLKIIW